MTSKQNKRCAWCDENTELYVAYHDTEWGVPVDDDRKLFEMLILEGMQAGLSWITILKKRENFLAAFDNFDVEKVARYNEKKIGKLLKNKGIIRNRLKIQATVKNARVFLELKGGFGSFATYLWNWVDFSPIQNRYEKMADLPAKTTLSEEVSKDLKKRGMNFVGPTIIYSLMQAVGMVNDHEVSCFRHTACMALAEEFIKNRSMESTP